MKRRWLAGLCLAMLLLPWAVLAESAATLPPGLPASVGAPQVALDVRLCVPETRVCSLREIAASDAMIAVSGQIETSQGSRADAIWEIDPVTGTCSLLYEARLGVQIVTPVYCGQRLYWAETREDQSDGWAIRRWDAGKRRAELVSKDSYKRSSLAPALSIDGDWVYWYESGAEFAQQPPYQRLPVSLCSVMYGAAVERRFELETAVDWQPPHVRDGVLASAAYESGGWNIRLSKLAGREDTLIPLADMPMDVQSNGAYVAWRQAGQGDAEPSEQGDQARSEEEPLPQEHAGDLSGKLWIAELDAPRNAVCVDARVDALLLMPEGAYYVSDTRALCFYSFELGRVLKLTGFADYLPALCLRGDSLYGLRAIADGQEVRYRAAVIDVSALRQPGWPPLE